MSSSVDNTATTSFKSDTRGITIRDAQGASDRAVSEATARYRYRQEMNSGEVQQLREAVYKMVSHWTPEDKLRILSEYGSGELATASTRKSAEKINELVTETLIINLSESAKNTLLKDFAVRESKLLAETRKLNRRSMALKSTFNAASFSTLANGDTLQSKNTKTLIRERKKFDRSFKVDRGIVNKYKGLKKELDAVLDGYNVVQLTLIAQDMDIPFKENASKKDVINMVGNYCILYVDLINGKKERMSPGISITPNGMARLEEILGSTSFSWTIGKEGMSSKEVALRRREAQQLKARIDAKKTLAAKPRKYRGRKTREMRRIENETKKDFEGAKIDRLLKIATDLSIPIDGKIPWDEDSPEAIKWKEKLIQAIADKRLQLYREKNKGKYSDKRLSRRRLTKWGKNRQIKHKEELAALKELDSGVVKDSIETLTDEDIKSSKERDMEAFFGTNDLTKEQKQQYDQLMESMGGADGKTPTLIIGKDGTLANKNYVGPVVPVWLMGNNTEVKRNIRGKARTRPTVMDSLSKVTTNNVGSLAVTVRDGFDEATGQTTSKRFSTANNPELANAANDSYANEYNKIMKNMLKNAVKPVYFSDSSKEFGVANVSVQPATPVYIVNKNVGARITNDTVYVEQVTDKTREWLGSNMPIIMTGLQMAGTAFNAAGVAAGALVASEAIYQASEAGKVLARAAFANQGFSGDGVRYATGGYGSAAKTKSNSSSIGQSFFISGDSLNSKPNPEQVSIDWANQTYAVKPIPQTTPGTSGKPSAEASAAAGISRRMTAGERKAPMEVGIMNALVSYKKELPSGYTSYDDLAIKVLPISPGITDKVDVGGGSYSLIELIANVNNQLASLNALTAAGVEVMSNQGTTVISAGGRSTEGYSSFPTDLNSILQGK